MRSHLVALLVLLAAASAHVVPSAQPPPPQGPDLNAYYQIGPDSLPHEGVPKGEVRGPFVLPSQAYPGTQHTYWVYVPAQYDPAVAASLMIFQDGQAFKDMDGVVRAPNVLDNLTYRREIPVMIGVFINPGRTPEQPEPTPSNWGDRDTNRPTEYNTLDDKYARVVVDELMPALYKDYNISKDPDRHGIGGASSGAIAAFTVAWQRPNDFRKVLSIVGSFVNLRGGDAYADIVRQSDRKPIRIFLQDGRNDNRGVGRGGNYDERRDWFYQNVRLMRALTDKGYDVNYAWGMNTHGQRMGGPMLPEMMRWLWRDHPVSTDVNDAVERSFNEPKKRTAADDHQRVMDLFRIARLPPGPRSGCPETYDEATANPFPTLPDPLVMKNGRKVTSAAMWTERRAEILEDFEREIYGRTPKVTPKVKWEVSTSEGTAGQVPTITKRLVGHVDNSSYPAITVDIEATLTIPRNATGPVPVMLIIGGGGLGTAGARGAVPAARGPVVPVVCDNAVARAFATAAAANPPAAPAPPAGPRAGLPGAAAAPGRGVGGPNQTQILLLAKGWGYATVNPASIQADNGAGLTQGIIGLVNKGQHRSPDDWGALSAWAWGASRVLDYFETDRSVNARQVGLEGHSRYGKATILAMALDERFAIAYVSSSGEGGAKLHRRKYGELVQNVAAANEYHWMAENHMKYAGKWDAMPVDSHELVALCAPRPVFLSTGKGPETNPDGTVAMRPDGSAASINDAWVDPRGTFLAGAGASPVYKLLGKKPMKTKAFPAIETLVDGDVAFRQHGGGHTDGPNWPVFLRWAERYIGAKAPGAKQEPSPKAWIDADTGHRVVRLTDDAGGSTLYFHDNAFSPQGDTMMFNTPNGIAIVDVAKIGTDGARPEIVAPRARGGYFARRTREIYFNASGSDSGNGRGTSSGTVTALNIDTRRTRDVPNARGLINADETLSVVKNGSASDPDGKYPRPPTRPLVPQLQRMFPGKTMDELTPDQRFSVTKEDGLAARALNPTLQSFVFTNLKTGEPRETGFQYGDLNHLQFNPVDPNLLLYCHEGTWHELDRTWTIRTDGSQMRLMHKRTMDMEINGHEWWSWDGKTVWFDLQTPRSQDFWIAGVNMETGRTTRYHLERSWWGVHFNSSRDDTLFASDGGDASQVAYATDGMWINLLRVQAPGSNRTMTREKLVNMSRHSYVTARGGVEPNVHITPDRKWVVFTGQFAQGQRHVYAVEIDKVR